MMQAPFVIYTSIPPYNSILPSYTISPTHSPNSYSRPYSTPSVLGVECHHAALISSTHLEHSGPSPHPKITLCTAKLPSIHSSVQH